VRIAASPGLANATATGQSSRMTAETGRTYRLDHVAFGVPDVAATTPFLVGELGGRPFGAGPGVEFLWWQWQFERGGVLEVLEPDGPPGGFIHRFLESRGPGVHHVTFKVPDLAAAAARAESRGYSVVGYNDASTSWKECFLHPKQAQGIVVQLAESNPDLGSGGVAGFPYPDAPAPAGERTDVLGLRLTTRSEANARRQWGDLLGGSCESTDRGLHFQWPESPLRIVVVLDEDSPPGPIAIDVESPLSKSLPNGPHPILGIPFAHIA
jgi:methylmalonyl-CoA/ethylmalonyl-CoA epimerase